MSQVLPCGRMMDHHYHHYNVLITVPYIIPNIESSRCDSSELNGSSMKMKMWQTPENSVKYFQYSYESLTWTADWSWDILWLIMISRARYQRFKRLLCIILICFRLESGSAGNPDAKRLYDDLLSNYNKLVRPVVNVSDALTVKIKLKLSQLIDVVSSFNFVFVFSHTIKHLTQSHYQSSWHLVNQPKPYARISILTSHTLIPMN